ncbi:3-dehydroquinate dehydratase [Candidatus Electrothrix aarhusensis]|jgi:3-dehydroquinate dehydratase-1/3-dehydroquinate dehydratase/shikimate dehydrogenase|uniref:3-dehydroquinate dehydratase n=1 Tax=Candidatus Electrothrix aarhusensis TaxID=1859131 RepID=A0A3S3R0W7_9BACT|nr:3-dehydroquinate dehydratase [Candidatus Electrothrix aarhusensis]
MAQMTRGKICVSLAGADVAALLAQVSQIGERADVIEVRLDSMQHSDVSACCAVLDKPLLFTHRPSWEGGAFDRSEEQRIEPLLEAIQQQAAYVDCELRAEQTLRDRLLDAMSGGPTRMILSWHNFEVTPPQEELEKILAQMVESDAGTGKIIGKIVTTAHSAEDALRVLHLQEQAKAANFPLSCFCMGEPGRITRLATLYLGGYMSYVCLDNAQATAPGQLSLEQLQELTALLAVA